MTSGGAPARWNGWVILLHWVGAALILELLAHGWLMVHGGFSAARVFDLYQQHKALGLVVLALTAARLVARAASRRPPPLPGARWERGLAALVQALLYLLALAAAGSGWLAVSASPLPIPISVFGLFVAPAIASPGAPLFAAATLAHQLSGLAIAGLVALHVAGALKHRLHDRDGVFSRIAPRLSLFRPPLDETGQSDGTARRQSRQ